MNNPALNLSAVGWTKSAFGETKSADRHPPAGGKGVKAKLLKRALAAFGITSGFDAGLLFVTNHFILGQTILGQTIKKPTLKCP